MRNAGAGFCSWMSKNTHQCMLSIFAKREFRLATIIPRNFGIQRHWPAAVANFLRAYSTEVLPKLSSDIINIMDRRILDIEYRTAHLQRLMEQPEASQADYSKANKELRKLRQSVHLIHELRAKQKEMLELKSVVAECQDDRDMQEMASQEMNQVTEDEKRLRYLLLKMFLPQDDADERDCILEVRAGTGGEEASLFAMDIFRMYEKYSVKKGWKFETLDVAASDLKGYKEAIASISGADVYGKLKFESGIHRVQRVPVTEKSGRVHTSAVSVAILPQADQKLLSRKVWCLISQFFPSSYSP